MLDEPRLKVISGGRKKSSPKAWGLVVGTSGKPDPCIANAVALVEHAHDWGQAGVLRYDTFADAALLEGRRISEADELALAVWLQRGWNTKFSDTVASKAIRAVALRHMTDSLGEYVEGVAWDGVARVDTFAPAYLAAEDTPHHRAAGRVLLLSMAARALHPGCKVDTMVILEGAQGTGKSTAAAILGGPFFAELHASVGTQAAQEQVKGSWLMEVGELDAMSRAEVGAAKKFMSSQSDRFRRAYARDVADVPRRCVMVGTTNVSVYLRDETGARRWLPIRCGSVDLAALRRDRDQLHAEAVARVKAGMPWHLSDADEVKAAAAAAEERYEEDPWSARLEEYVRLRDTVTMDECFSILTVPVEARNQGLANRISKILVHLKWTRGRRWNARIGNSERCYTKP